MPNIYFHKISTWIYISRWENKKNLVEIHLRRGSNINEVIKTVLNFFIFLQKISQPQKSTKRLQAIKSKKCF